MRTALLTVAAVLFTNAFVYSQQCTPTTAGSGYESCNQMLEASEILQTRAGIGLSSGNPVPGANSTLGMRIGNTPRISIAARFTGVGLDMPGVALNESDFRALAHSINADFAVGIYSGKMLAPTIGGFGSLDLVGSVGKLSLPSSHGITSDPGSWALGARLGILRESFTAPGISITGMYRHIGDMAGSLGSTPPSGANRAFALRNNSDFSVRGVIGKRLFVVGANAGLGYDSYKSDVTASATGFGAFAGTATYSESGRKLNRMTGFVNATWTMLIVNFVAEAGFQRGGETFAQPLPSGQNSKTQNTGYYGSLAVRLAL